MKPPKVLLLLSDGFEALEASYFTDVLGWSSENGGPVVEMTTCGLKKDLKCTWSLKVTVDYLISEVDSGEYDALAIPGGFAEAGFYKDAYSKEFANLIREFDNKSKIIASVCVGSLVIANSGILKNRRATTYQLNGLRVDQLREFGALVEKDNIVTDNNIVTSSSPATGIGSAFILLRMLTSEENMVRVATLMGFDSNMYNKWLNK